MPIYSKRIQPQSLMSSSDQDKYRLTPAVTEFHRSWRFHTWLWNTFHARKRWTAWKTGQCSYPFPYSLDVSFQIIQNWCISIESSHVLRKISLIILFSHLTDASIRAFSILSSVHFTHCSLPWSRCKKKTLIVQFIFAADIVPCRDQCQAWAWLYTERQLRSGLNGYPPVIVSRKYIRRSASRRNSRMTSHLFLWKYFSKKSVESNLLPCAGRYLLAEGSLPHELAEQVISKLNPDHLNRYTDVSSPRPIDGRRIPWLPWIPDHPNNIQTHRSQSIEH